MVQIDSYYCISEAGGEPAKTEATSYLAAAIKYMTLHNYSTPLDALRTELMRSIPGSRGQPAKQPPGVRVYRANTVALIDWEKGQLFRVIITEDMTPTANLVSASVTIKRI